jgi:Arc/MetJ-type ribon-helix-helix transcriptional regulator
MEILNIKVESKTLEILNMLVKKKTYKNKSEAVRKILEAHFDQHPELFGPDDLDDLIKKADGISDQKFEQIAAKVFRGPKTAAKLIAEGRER